MSKETISDQGIYYRTNDWLDGRPFIVFMHGVSGSSSAWFPHEQLFTKTYNILSFDLRGHGQSKKYAHLEDYQIKLFSKDLVLLTEHLGVAKFTLITHSYGVLIALEFLRENQEKIISLVLMSPSYNVSNTLIARVVKPLFIGTRLFRFIPFNPKPGSHIDYERHRNARDWNIPMTFDDVRNTGLRIYLFASQQAFSVKYEDLLVHIHVPVLLIHGKRDSIFPPTNSEEMKKRIPNAEIVFLDDADHIIVVNHIDTVSPIMKEFVLRTNPVAPPLLQ